MPWPLHPWGNSSQYPLNRTLSGPQSQSGHGGEDKNPYPNQELNPIHPDLVLIIMLTALSQLMTYHVVKEYVNVTVIKFESVPLCRIFYFGEY
jgi:hypothetical protein